MLLKITRLSYAQEVLSILSKIGYSTESIPTQVLKKLAKKYEASCKDGVRETIVALLIDKMKKDKKNRNGVIRLVLQEDIMKNQLREVAVSTIREVLQ